jgi:heme o synthase
MNQQAPELAPAGNRQRPADVAAAPSRRPSGEWRDWWQLCRPGIVTMVLVTMSVAAFVAPPAPPSWLVLFHSLLGSGLVIVGAIALNQRLEQASDAQMKRTARRPLPSQRLRKGQVTWFGVGASAAGLIYLSLLTTWTVPVLAAVSWLLYVWMYTPLKRLSAWQTPLGAVAGAMPTLMGAAAAGATLTGVMPLTLFAIVYLWQFPHAMAIAWMYRDDFAAARLKVATVVDPSGRVATRLALCGAIALLVASLAPWFAQLTGWGYAIAGLLFGLGYLAATVVFWARPTNASARALLRSSLVYLPAICAALLWTARG